MAPRRLPLLALCLLYYLSQPPDPRPAGGKGLGSWTQESKNQNTLTVQSDDMDSLTATDPCGRQPRDLDDVFVVIKTGATESQQRIPVHLRTTLQCVPHFAIFSDYEETINGVQVHDILKNVSKTTMEKEPEFELYRRLQEVGREGLTDEEWGDDTNGPLGKTNNPGWKLDKWKFLPMIDSALELKPDAKWYIFAEADTYLAWPNLVNWLAHLDHNEPYYIGSPMQIGNELFAYGGSGIILSARTMQRLSSYRARAEQEMDKMTAEEWAGDCVLARALGQVRVSLTWAWPMMLTVTPSELDHFSEGYGRQPWCYPAISYHHMSPKDIEDMWRFERAWFSSGKNALLLHADVFRKHIHNASLSERSDWDNLSNVNIDSVSSAEACHEACSHDSDCLQWSFGANEGCKHASTTLLGVPTNGTHSGWMKNRVQKLLDLFQSSCPQVEYIFD
ncbi:hypothetical protein N7474_010228 [Penicillium riverlandense]|uniref:uncharacterized protein n=1 Tax=Penicillium riverlandense TaxID=1903569 RepID=UPI0025485F41|nr:uncharacterized protein N7474_010228 [Penicillium riverlandense]KAJ5808959.1 hypothetical protein N7474_010228 [Penicillium riverlandense]